MSAFTIYPAIDLRRGEVICLRQGDPGQQTTYSSSPGGMAQQWLEAGADWLHVVNLDGAFGEDTAPNLEALAEILGVCKGKAKIQFGGGLRDLVNLRKVFELGIARAILGTAVVENMALVEAAVAEYGGEKIAIGVDAKEGIVMTRGWQEDSGIKLSDFCRSIADIGIQTLIYTDISRDGMGTGVNLENTRKVSVESGLQVIASGGVASLEDVRRVKAAGLQGVIIGRAIYEGDIDLKEALVC
jgi:phosphoribosylformimino-5-aminoimidazole carboxamide ribotide isomerase